MGDYWSKLCAGLCVVGALAFLPACGSGGGKSSGGDCAENEQKATVDGAEGCFPLCVEGICDVGQRCVQGLCLQQGATNVNVNGDPNGTPNGDPNGTPNGDPNANPNGDPNANPNGDPNANPNGDPNADPNANPNNVMIDPAHVALCEEYWDLIFGSCLSTCTLDAETQSNLDTALDISVNGRADDPGTPEDESVPACAETLATNPTFVEQLQEYVTNNTCETNTAIRCGEFGLAEECNCAPPTNLGDACDMDDQCMSGDLRGICVAEADGGSPGGECAAGFCPGFGQAPSGFTYEYAGCGDGNICQNVVPEDGSSPYGICWGGCDGNAECRGGWLCQISNILQPPNDAGGTDVSILRWCAPSCSANSDCLMGWRCNAGVCEFPCDGTPDPNDPDARTAQQVCVDGSGTCTVDPNDQLEYCVFPL